MMDRQQSNKPLFSQHYLEYRLQESPEWQEDVAAGFAELKDLYLSKENLLSTLSEAQTEEVFIKPVLEILGFSYIPQVTTSGRGRAERPDYGLFIDDSERDAAYLLQNNETAFYGRVMAIAEAKYWDRPLSKVSANDGRDIYKNTNPSFQIASYLAGTGVDWGILTNGREWRLYSRLASSTATEFYQVDLVELLEGKDIDYLDQFKYFWLFFRSAAFIKDPQGRNFLERVREGSNTYAQRVGDELKKLVFDQIFPELAGGFVVDANRRGEEVTELQVYEATLSFLYKVLFLLFAEARNLLPMDNDDYREQSLISAVTKVALSIERQQNFSKVSTILYDRLLSLFQIVDQGDRALSVPRYNGGLFHFYFREEEARNEYQANYFLYRFKLSDAVLAPVLDQLARFEGQLIDYSFLGVRQLGSIYEGLLEYKVIIDDRTTGEAHLENDKGERKATGSYYTPDYIVKYIVSHTLKPILEQRQARFGELMEQISAVHHQLQDQRLGVQSRQGLQRDLQRLEREAQKTLLDIKVCDPAMGSGHFLVESVDYLTDELIQILTTYPNYNPVLKMLDETRQSILENLQQQGIRISPDKLEPTQLLQRVVMKRCIYGVDLNPMAVELAKVSLWLHSFTVGAPLSFLDHHLRCGNSLIGTTARAAEIAMQKEDSGQVNLLTGPFVGLLRAAEIMRGVSVLSDATFAEVEQSERLFRAFDEAAKPYKRVLDIYVSQFFGLKQAKSFLERFGTDAITADSQKMSKPDATVCEEAQKLSEDKHFFHWDLEFPEVFIDLENARWDENAGFDAVVGNPPYDELSEETRSSVANELIYFKSTPKLSHALGYRINIYRLFIVQAIHILKVAGKHSFIVPLSLLADQFTFKLRKYLLENTEINVIEQFPQKDDPNRRIFFEAKLSTCIYILCKKLPSQYQEVYVRTHLGRKILDDSLNYKTLQTSFFNFDKLNFSIPGLDVQSWNLILKLSNSEKLLRFSDFITASPGELMINSSFKPYLSDSLSGEEVIRGSHIGRYQIVAPKQGEPIFFNRELYLAEHINSKKAVAYQNTRVIYQRYAAIDNYRRLIATILPINYFCSHTTGYLLDIKSYELGFLTALLNANLLDWRFSLTSTNNNINSYEIEALPIPKINFTTPLDRRHQALENLITLYTQYQTNGNLDRILAQTRHHLSQQPEEADIIHDFLAYLAAQMIELNQQKQAEIKAFLKWLADFIGCPIDTLTNKSKIQNYLGDYAKNEPYLSFRDLIAVLKKNSKKIAVDPIARRVQESIEPEYQQSLDTLLPIKTKLIQCDTLINVIVYQLYGLTAEEIAIVEGKP